MLLARGEDRLADHGEALDLGWHLRVKRGGILVRCALSQLLRHDRAEERLATPGPVCAAPHALTWRPKAWRS